MGPGLKLLCSSQVVLFGTVMVAFAFYVGENPPSCYYWLVLAYPIFCIVLVYKSADK